MHPFQRTTLNPSAVVPSINLHLQQGCCQHSEEHQQAKQLLFRPKLTLQVQPGRRRSALHRRRGYRLLRCSSLSYPALLCQRKLAGGSDLGRPDLCGTVRVVIPEHVMLPAAPCLKPSLCFLRSSRVCVGVASSVTKTQETDRGPYTDPVVDSPTALGNLYRFD